MIIEQNDCIILAIVGLPSIKKMKTDSLFPIAQKILKTTAGVELKQLQRKERIGKTKDSVQGRGDFAVSLEYPGKLAEVKDSFLWAVIKENLNSSVINSLYVKVKSSSQKILLITNQVTSGQAENLRELNIPFCDAAGNAFLNERGLYVFVTGKKTQTVNEKPSRAFDKAGLKIIFALLTNPGLIQKDLRTIAGQAGVASVSTVSDIFKNLEKQHYLYQPKSIILKRKLINRTKLLDRWVEGYLERLRPALRPVRFVSRKFEGRWWNEVEIKDYNAVWGGERGGELLTNHLRPATVTIYADSHLPKLQVKYGLFKEKQGNVEILEKFWTAGELGNVAPPLVVYADLIATGDERNLETAQMVYERYLVELTKESA